MSFQTAQWHKPNVVADQCAECDEDVAVGEGVICIEEAVWVRERNATVWCSVRCCDDWSETAGEARDAGRIAAYYG